MCLYRNERFGVRHWVNSAGFIQRFSGYGNARVGTTGSTFVIVFARKKIEICLKDTDTPINLRWTHN